MCTIKLHCHIYCHVTKHSAFNHVVCKMSVLVSKKKLVQQVKIIYIQIEILKKYIIFKNYMSANKGSFWYLAATI